VLGRGLRLPEAIALFAAVGLAVTTKATSYALLPAALLVLAVGLARLQGREAANRARSGSDRTPRFPDPGWCLARDRARARPAGGQQGRDRAGQAESDAHELQRTRAGQLHLAVLPSAPFLPEAIRRDAGPAGLEHLAEGRVGALRLARGEVPADRLRRARDLHGRGLCGSSDRGR